MTDHHPHTHSDAPAQRTGARRLVTRLTSTIAGALTLVALASGSAHAEPRDPLPEAAATGQAVADLQAAVAYVQQQQLDAYLRAVAFDQWLAALPRIAVDTAHWTAINRCEENGVWVNDGWTSDGHFQGGLGMSVDAWNSVIAEAARYGVALPASSNDATPFEQMEGAQLLYNRVGPGGWACKA